MSIYEIAAFLRDVLRVDPADGGAGALLGNHLIKRAWAVRTSYGATAVSRERFAAFHETLRLAEQVLSPTAAAAPGDPAIWVARLTAARGLQMGQAEARRRYDRLAAIDPHHLPGQSSFAQQLAPKWGGSWEALHTFCREAARTAPPGAPNAMLIVTAHLERWMDIRGVRIGTANAYLRPEPVRTEIEQAAQQSVWHPEFQQDLRLAGGDQHLRRGVLPARRHGIGQDVVPPARRARHRTPVGVRVPPRPGGDAVVPDAFPARCGPHPLIPADAR